MIKINNNIGDGIDCSILYKGKSIGKCNNLLAFYDALCQIKNEKSNDYQMLVKTRLPNGDVRDFFLTLDYGMTFSIANFCFCQGTPIM